MLGMKSLIFHFPRRGFHVYTVGKHKRANFLPLILIEAAEFSWWAVGWPRVLSVTWLWLQCPPVECIYSWIITVGTRELCFEVLVENVHLQHSIRACPTKILSNLCNIFTCSSVQKFVINVLRTRQEILGKISSS